MLYYTATTAVIGFERTSYTGMEGEQIEICVTTFSGVNNLPNGLSVLIHFDYQAGMLLLSFMYNIKVLFLPFLLDHRAINQFTGYGCVNFSSNTRLDEDLTIPITITQLFAGESGALIQPDTATLLVKGGSYT